MGRRLRVAHPGRPRLHGGHPGAPPPLPLGPPGRRPGARRPPDRRGGRAPTRGVRVGRRRRGELRRELRGDPRGGFFGSRRVGSSLRGPPIAPGWRGGPRGLDPPYKIASQVTPARGRRPGSTLEEGTTAGNAKRTRVDHVLVGALT